MIGKLSGIIEYHGEDHLILGVAGVGYIIHAHQRDISRCGAVGEAASFWIEMIVREDSQSLYGFLDRSEQSWFKELISVQGVGAKAGMAILQVCPPEMLYNAILSQDKASIRRADGVGPKLAVRIVTELKDRAVNIGPGRGDAAFISPDSADPITAEGLPDEASRPAEVKEEKDSDNNKSSPPPGIQESLAATGRKSGDAVSALVNLGYGQAEAFGAVRKVIEKIEPRGIQTKSGEILPESDHGLQTLIKSALKILNSPI